MVRHPRLTVGYLEFFDRFKGGRILEGERRLMLAVLEDAVSCFRKYAGATRPRNQRLFREAEEWFMDEDASWPFAFEAVCSNPDEVHPLESAPWAQPS